MIVTRSKAREKVVAHLNATLSTHPYRVRYPGQPKVNIADNKAMYLEVRLVYMDGWSTGIGPNTDMRLLGIIEVTFNFKEGNPADQLASETMMDIVQRLVHSTDVMTPVRTYGTRQETQREGPESGWVTETLVTPFWYDTSR